jgi:N6-adenosine-specific RNA methylase IME4
MKAVERSNLDDLAARIRCEHEATISGIRRSAEHAMAVGDLLAEAKRLVGHGAWLPWIEANCQMSTRTAQDYMRLAKARSEIEANAQNSAHLSVLGAMKLLAPSGEDEPDEMLVARGEREILETAQMLRSEKTQERREQRLLRIAAQADAGPLPEHKFPIILCDPPWSYEFSPTHTRAIEQKYETMSLDEIRALPVENLAADDALLFLWVTPPILEQAFQVIRAWNFEYRTGAVWDKQIIGAGHWFRQQHEHLLVGRRGQFPTAPEAARASSIISARRREHSRKPDEVYQLIERMYPDLPKVELFARFARKGWHAWGNQAPGAAA